MISSLSLRNWRTHQDTRVHFGKGTNLIIGIMGSGKSGLLNALSYALFGTFPQLRRRETSLEDAIRYGENEAEISLEFSHQGTNYRIIRKFKRNGGRVVTASRLFAEHKLIESGSKRVSESVSSLLEVDYPLFTRAIYSEQNNIDYFLTIDPGKRKKELDRLLGLDRFETARAASVSLLNRIASEADSLSSLFNMQEYDSLKKQEASKSALLKSHAEKSRSLEQQHASLKQSVSTLASTLSKLESLLKKRDALNSTIARANARVELLSSKLEGKTPSASSLEKKKESLNSLSLGKKALDLQISNIEKSISALSLSLGKTASQLDDAKASLKKTAELESALTSLSSSLKNPEKLLEEKESGIIALASKIESLSSEIPELEDALSKLKTGSSECPVCDSPLSPSAAGQLILQKKGKVLQKKSALSAFLGQLPKLKEEKRSLSMSLEKMRQLSVSIGESKKRSSSLPALEKEKGQKELEISRLRAEKSALLLSREKGEAEYSALLNLYREEESLLNDAKLLLSAKKEQAKAQEEISKIEFDDSNLVNVRKEFQQATVSLERSSSALSSLKKEQASASEFLSLISTRMQKMENAKKESEYLQKLKTELQIYRNSLLELQSELRSELTGAISSAMNNIWPILYPYADYRYLRIVATEKDYSFEINDGEWRRLENTASGGEKACLSLTLRIALSTILTPNVGWMMLDEPTHNLDREAIQTLSEALENKVPEIIPQSIVITHEENLISSEFARSYKFSRDKERLGPTIVESL